jgi:hypothetical protein
MLRLHLLQALPLRFALVRRQGTAELLECLRKARTRRKQHEAHHSNERSSNRPYVPFG